MSVSIFANIQKDQTPNKFSKILPVHKRPSIVDFNALDF